MNKQGPDAPKTVNALATATHLDRRTVAHHLARVPPDEVEGASRRWRLSTLADAMVRNGSKAVLPSPINPLRALCNMAGSHGRFHAFAALGAGWFELTRPLGIADDVAKRLFVQAVVTGAAAEQGYVTRDDFSRFLARETKLGSIDIVAEKFLHQPFNSSPPTECAVQITPLAREWCKEVCGGELSEELTIE